MDIVDLLVSLNKISLVALIVIIGFLSYQIYLLKKETDSKKKKLVVPDFKESNNATFTQPTKVVLQEKKKLYTRSLIWPIIIGIILFFIFGLIFIFGLLQQKFQDTRKNQNISPTPIINFVASRGIKIYNQNWEALSDGMLKKLAPNHHIIVGIEIVKGADIDMARIRFNKNKWDKDDITFKFNQKENVFFNEFIISTGEAFLKVEAELHSKTDGWLGN